MAKRVVKNKRDGQTYFEYLSYIKQNVPALFIKNAAHYLKKYTLLSAIVNQLPCAIYILDYRTQQYLFVSKNCVHLFGYTSEEFMENGQAWQLKNFHPDDLATFSSHIFTGFLNYTKSLPEEELKKLRFSINLRLKRKDGIYIQALQQYVVIETDKDGNPILTLGFVTDITAHKQDTKMTFAVSKYDPEKGFSIITTDTFPHAKIMVSNRENEIIKHLIQGLSSKAIAEQLHVSMYTINAHRRNILGKTKCKNTAELINYALENGLG
jgi:PAS domain S-box-containing protein